MEVFRSHMEGKGYGWMFDVEDAEDEDERRPLMEELEIDPADIIHKAVCVLVCSSRDPRSALCSHSTASVGSDHRETG